MYNAELVMPRILSSRAGTAVHLTPLVLYIAELIIVYTLVAVQEPLSLYVQRQVCNSLLSSRAGAIARLAPLYVQYRVGNSLLPVAIKEP
jgi:hypothetical protein